MSWAAGGLEEVAASTWSVQLLEASFQVMVREDSAHVQQATWIEGTARSSKMASKVCFDLVAQAAALWLLDLAVAKESVFLFPLRHIVLLQIRAVQLSWYTGPTGPCCPLEDFGARVQTFSSMV